MTNAELADEIERSQVEIWPQEEPVSVNDGRVMTDAEKQQIIAALRRQPSSDKVLVPREPTPRMFEAGWRALNPKPHLTDLGEAYRAMLAAAEAEGHHE